jgi:hypothetical protein
MSTCKGKRDREKRNMHTRETGETGDGAVVPFLVCLPGKSRDECKEER